MLGLKLRSEFQGKRLKGTTVELANDAKTGATQVTAKEFLEITYPTRDLLTAIEAVGPNQGRPVVVMGERGAGKSHLLAALYHAVNDAPSTRAWLNSWAATLADPSIGKLSLRDSMLVIGESLHRQRYKYLWDILFARHPQGTYFRGKWEGMGASKTDVPSDQLIVEMLKNTPTMLLLDEFQTWYDGLTNSKQAPLKNWAFNFIQILSEIAKEHPELLVLVVSVRNGETDAYQQIHRVNPVQIDFKAGGNPERIQQDRRRMLLHRLFENRLQVPQADIESLISKHIAEVFRLLDIPPTEYERKHAEFLEAWPFAPHLLQLLEDQVLVATDAQETRDLIRILANLYKTRGASSAIMTAGDFRLDDDLAGIGALLDSVANQQHRTLREKALRNITSVLEAVPDHATKAPHLPDIMGALWLRSIAVGNIAGAEPATLQVDITKAHPIDDNAFQVELATIIDNSFNIHQLGSRLVFREEENPQAKLMANARNDKVFADGSDLEYLAKEIRYSIAGSDDVAKTFRVIVLPKSWQSDPWSDLEEAERPEQWDGRLPIIVLPDEPDKMDERLGRWLKDHLQKRRNTVRFLLPRTDSISAFLDRDLLILARAALKAKEWSSQAAEYERLHKKYQGELRDLLKKRFDRFAILSLWNYADPAQCVFHVESLRAQGTQIPDAIEDVLARDLFVPEDFADLALTAAAEGASVGKLLRDLQEPRPAGKPCIPWLGETAMKERVLKLCACGLLAINLRGMEYLQAQPGEDEDTAWKRLKAKMGFTGRQLDEIHLLLPSAVPTTGGAKQQSDEETHQAVGNIFGGAGVTHVPTPGGAHLPAGSGPIGPGPVTSGPTGAGPTGIFGGASTPKEYVQLSNPATSPLNLIGKLEQWGIGPGTNVTAITLKLAVATGAQLKELLKRLPEGMTFELAVEKEDS
jgi:hypothetical protein